MTPSYIPAPDADFNNWLNNFSTLLTADPTAVGETAGTALVLAADVTAWNAAYATATNPATRTAPAVAAKDNARVAAEATVRPIAIRIRNNAAVTDAQRVDYGVTVPKLVPTPIPAPTSFPIIGLRAATPGVHQLQYTDSDAPSGKAKPFGAVGIELWRSVGTVPATDPSQCTFYGTATKSPFRSTFITADAGKVCTYFARWNTKSGPGGMAQTGPWSAPLSVVIV